MLKALKKIIKLLQNILITMDEISLISKLTNSLSKPKELLVPIGDDCAYMDSGNGITLYTTDTMVEGVHFDLSYFTPADLARKLTAVNLSDIASCGGEPMYALMSLTIPAHIDTDFLTEFYNELNRLTSVYNFVVIGGDVTSGREFNLTMTVIGKAARVNAVRSNARAGDVLFGVGNLGWAGLGLEILSGRFSPDNIIAKDKATKALINPVPLLSEGRWLSDNVDRLAMIDCSDGLSNCAYWIGVNSNVSIVIEPDKAIDSDLAAIYPDAKGLTYSSGDDYALIGTMSVDDWEKVKKIYPGNFTHLRQIGQVIQKNTEYVYEELIINGKPCRGLSPIKSKGYSHFK